MLGSPTVLASAATTCLAVLALAASVTEAHKPAQVGHHRLHRRASPPSHHWSSRQMPGGSNKAKFITRSKRMAAKRGEDFPLSEPTNPSKGSMTAEQGCTAWYNVVQGDSCYSAIATLGGNLSLDDFYSMNPQVNEDCFNLWAGYDYCVAKGKVPTNARKPVRLAVSKTVAPTTTTTTTTTTTPPAPTSTASEEDDDDWVCDDEEDVSTPSVRANAVQTTPAPKPTQDDSAANAAAASSKSAADAAAASSKAAADAAAAAASSSSAAAAAAASSKAAADAAWAASKSAEEAAAQAPTTTTSAPQQTQVADTGNSLSLLSQAGITGFLGQNDNAIVSWFRTNSAEDSTNGNSWCYRPYDDSIAGFAPDVTTMLNNFGGSNIEAGKAYCGLIAEFTLPDGKTVELTLVDGFDSRWVRTPASVDVVIGAFDQFYGSYPTSKDQVVQGVSWKFTGKRNPNYVFNNGNPVGGGW
ncbi:hypothetical protein OIO90_005875 [Microbotryomycetes sp. JL221]|nr:hypothetical protein OIO90_005875 [Microbotryomycetes sp. JL221]